MNREELIAAALRGVYEYAHNYIGCLPGTGLQREFTASVNQVISEIQSLGEKSVAVDPSHPDAAMRKWVQG